MERAMSARRWWWLSVVALACVCVLPAIAAAADGTLEEEQLEAEPARECGNVLAMARWSPYAVGIGIGVLSWLAFLLSDKPLGCSTAFARTAGMAERLARGPKVDAKPYYQQFKPAIDWEWMLVLGVLGGALASAALSGSFELSWVPAKWAADVGTSAAVRWLVALAGGFCIGFGARWAGGCTSGHGISGTLQLAVSSWIAAMGFFVGGIATAMLLYHVILGGGGL